MIIEFLIFLFAASFLFCFVIGISLVADNEKKYIYFFILSIIFLILICVTIYSDFGNNARASQKAQLICESRGFDVYESFNRIDWSDTPMGVKCNYVNNKKEYVGLNNPIVAVK